MQVVKASRPISPIKNGVTKPYYIACDDGEIYAVKFKQNPEGARVLANEFVCAELAQKLYLTTPIPSTIQISREFIKDYSGIISEHIGSDIQSGLHFGTMQIKKAFQITNTRMIKSASNIDIVPEILIFDQLVCNTDRDRNGGNLLFDFAKNEIVVLDHSHAFDLGAIWDAAQLRHRIGNPFFLFDSYGYVYKKLIPFISGNNPFHSIISKLKGISNEAIWHIISNIPDEWDVSELDKRALHNYIIDRKERIHEVLTLMQPMLPRWKGGAGNG
jgi:hypothetical protein